MVSKVLPNIGPGFNSTSLDNDTLEQGSTLFGAFKEAGSLLSFDKFTTRQRDFVSHSQGSLVMAPRSEYEKNPSYGHTRVHDNMVPWALRALGTKIGTHGVHVLARSRFLTTWCTAN